MLVQPTIINRPVTRQSPISKVRLSCYSSPHHLRCSPCTHGVTRQLLLTLLDVLSKDAFNRCCASVVSNDTHTTVPLLDAVDLQPLYPPYTHLSVPPDTLPPGAEHEPVCSTHLLLNTQLRCYPTPKSTPITLAHGSRPIGFDQ